MIATGFIHNTSRGTIHAAWFTEKPFPGGSDASADIVRWKSRGHHTEGAPDQQTANGQMVGLRMHLSENVGASEFVDIGAWEWDGEGVPAMCPVTSSKAVDS